MPISSSAHLIIFGELLNIYSEDLTIEVFLHFASLVAVLFFMRKKIKVLIIGFCLYIIKKEKKHKNDFLMILYLIISTIPVCVVAILFNDKINYLETNLLLIGCLLILNGFILLLISKRNDKNTINFKDALFIGLTQCIGILPGISRSGSCLVGANSRSINKDLAADYAFLLFVPASFGATLLKVKNIIGIVLDYM